MKLMILKASDDKYKEFKNFNSLEELVDFAEKEGSIILDDYYCEETDKYELGIMIYDDYIE